MIQAYGKYAIANQTLPKTRQIVLLYDGAINFLMQASDAMAAGNLEEKFTLLDKAEQIVSGLQSSLDFEQGGEVAKTLFEFYANLSAGIRDVMRSDNAGGIALLIQELKNMRAAWDKIDQGDTSGNQAAGGTAAPTIPSGQSGVMTMPAAVALSA